MSDVSEADLAAYAEDARQSVDGENILAQITRVSRELDEAREDVIRAEETLKAAQGRVRTLEEGTLPQLMQEAGQKKLRTLDGWDLELGETLRASIPAANMPAASAWLIDHNQAAIIKRAIGLKFGRDEADKAERALNLIISGGFAPEDKQSVHPQTLAAVIRELIAEGVDVPLELLGAHVQPFVKLTKPKPKPRPSKS